MNLSIFFNTWKSGSNLVPPSMMKLKRSWELQIPWPRTLYLKFPIWLTMLKKLLLSSSIWWYPDTTSKQAKNLAWGSTWRSSWLELSPPQTGRFKALPKVCYPATFDQIWTPLGQLCCGCEDACCQHRVQFCLCWGAKMVWYIIRFIAMFWDNFSLFIYL